MKKSCKYVVLEIRDVRQKEICRLQNEIFRLQRNIQIATRINIPKDKKLVREVNLTSE
jgi:hypothetical protein